MDSDIRRCSSPVTPDLALIVRRDGVILSCVGGNAVRGLDTPGRRNPRPQRSTRCGPNPSPRTCCRPCAAFSRRASPRSSATRMATSSSRCASRCRASIACWSCAAISAQASRPTIPACIRRAASARCCRIATASKNRCAWRSTWPRCAKTPWVSCSSTSAATSPINACSIPRSPIACSNPRRR